MEKAKLKRLQISRESWHKQPEATRYSVLMLGHIFNETIMLQKMSVIAFPRMPGLTPQHIAMHGQSVFVARLLAAKMYEASVTLNSSTITTFLKAECFPYMLTGRGEELRKAFNSAVGSSKWLATARNGHAMHYPTLAQWRNAMAGQASDKMGFEWIMGETWGDSYYASSADVSGRAFYMEAGENSWKVGVKEFADKVRDISKTLTFFLVECMNAYFTHFYDQHKSTKRIKLKDGKHFDLPLMKDTSLPFFYDMEGM